MLKAGVPSALAHYCNCIAVGRVGQKENRAWSGLTLSESMIIHYGTLPS